MAPRDFTCYYCPFASIDRDFSLFHMHNVHWQGIKDKFYGTTLTSESDKIDSQPEDVSPEEEISKTRGVVISFSKTAASIEADGVAKTELESPLGSPLFPDFDCNNVEDEDLSHGIAK